MNDNQARVGIGVMILKEGKFLIQRRKGSHGTGTWSIPGGHLEFGESFEATARREVREEVGIKIKNIRFGAVTNDILPADHKHYVSIWLLCDYDSGTPRILEPAKSDGLEWCTLDTLPSPLAPWWGQLFASEFIEKIRQEIEASAI